MRRRTPWIGSATELVRCAQSRMTIQRYWTTTNADRNTTGYGNVRAVLIPEKLELTGGFSVIDSKFHMFNVNDQTPTGGTAAQNLSATVENWPEVTTRLTPINLAVQYRLTQ